MIVSLYVGLSSDVILAAPMHAGGAQKKLKPVWFRTELRQILDDAYEGYTMTDCNGRWHGESEPSVRVDVLVNMNEVATVQHLFIVVGDICGKLGQECVMIVCRSEAHFESGKGPYVDRVDWLHSIDAAVPADWGMEIDEPAEGNGAHIGHAGSSGLAGHSVGEIYPYRLSLFGWNMIQVHDPAGTVIAWTTYDRPDKGLEGVFRTFGEAFQDMESFALNEKNDPMPADACRGNWFGADEAGDANTTIDYIRWAKSIIAESDETCRIDTSEALDFLVAFVSENGGH